MQDLYHIQLQHVVSSVPIQLCAYVSFSIVVVVVGGGLLRLICSLI